MSERVKNNGCVNFLNENKQPGTKKLGLIGACSGVYFVIMLMIQLEVVPLFQSTITWTVGGKVREFIVPFWARHFSVSKTLTGAYDKIGYISSDFLNFAEKDSLWQLCSFISGLAILLALVFGGFVLYGYNIDREDYRKTGAILGTILPLSQWFILYLTLNSEPNIVSRGEQLDIDIAFYGLILIVIAIIFIIVAGFIKSESMKSTVSET